MNIISASFNIFFRIFLFIIVHEEYFIRDVALKKNSRKIVWSLWKIVIWEYTWSSPILIIEFSNNPIVMYIFKGYFLRTNYKIKLFFWFSNNAFIILKWRIRRQRQNIYLFIYLLTRLITIRNPKEVDMTTCTRAGTI